MTVNDIYLFLDEKFPFALAAEWDNSGLILGDKDATVKKAVVALDCTADVVETAIKNGAELIISHHPVIFSGLKKITADGIVHRLIENKISVICAHTNLDFAVGGVNDCLCEALSLTDIKSVLSSEGFSFRTGKLREELSPAAFAKYVSEKLNLPVRFTMGKKNIKTVAVCGGSGGDLLYEAADIADALITADIKHNFFIEADNMGFTLLDGGHFNTEDTVIEPLKKALCEKFTSIEFITNHKSVINYI